jgi:segregation and condensation protein A
VQNHLHIQLPRFEGPLALLLFLIKKEEMDIFDIKIHEITDQYLQYMKWMKDLDLELAGEFIAMAATLLQIKSRMLLPNYDENGEVIETEDPRKELVQRLLEYQKYQEAGKTLYERPLLGRDIWTRGLKEKLELPEEEIEISENALFSLISAYRRALKSIKKKIHQVGAKAQSIASRILEIKDKLITGVQVAMSDLITAVDEKRKEILITFLSVLELAKLGYVNVYQTENFSEIYINAKKAIETDAISKVEEYNSVGNEELRSKIFSESNQILEEEIVSLNTEDDESESDESAQLATDEEIFNEELKIEKEFKNEAENV